MANPSVVGYQKATLNYVQQPTNILTLLPTGICLAERIAPLIGWTLPAWASNVSNACITSFTILEFSKVCSTAPSLAKDLKVAYDLFWAKKTVDEVRRDQKGDFPRADNPYNGPKIWTIYRLAATMFGFVSSGIALYSCLKAEGKVNPYLALAGAGFGAATHLIKIADQESKIRDLAKDVTDNDIPAHGMVRPRNDPSDLKGKAREVAANPDDQTLLVDLLPTQWRWDQIVASTFFLMKAVVFALVLKEVVSSTSLIGRVCQLVQTHKDDISRVLSVLIIGTTFAQHTRNGATVEELTKRKINHT